MLAYAAEAHLRSFASGSIRGRLRLILWYLDVATPTKRKEGCRCFNLGSDGSAQRTSSTDVGKFDPGHGLASACLWWTNHGAG
ncbi:hypothetical protein N7524_001276 [Penicillium chrysogenum]|nr:hypothetical protein N7524_001276 [Penicillium chrysogenum]